MMNRAPNAVSQLTSQRLAFSLFLGSGAEQFINLVLGIGSVVCFAIFNGGGG